MLGGWCGRWPLPTIVSVGLACYRRRPSPAIQCGCQKAATRRRFRAVADVSGDEEVVRSAAVGILGFVGPNDSSIAVCGSLAGPSPFSSVRSFLPVTMNPDLLREWPRTKSQSTRSHGSRLSRCEPPDRRTSPPHPPRCAQAPEPETQMALSTLEVPRQTPRPWTSAFAR